MRKLFHLKWLTAHWEWIMALLCLPVSFAFFNDFGLTWDSSAHVEYGQRVLSYFLSGFSDLSSLEMGNIRDKGPLFVLLSASVHRLFGLEPLTLWNLLIAAFAILTLPPLAGMGRLFGNQRVALFSVLALLLMPRFVGHAFTNPKDIPFACMVCWSMFTMTRFYYKGRFYVRDMLGCSVAIGLALSMRAGGVFLFFYVFLIGVFWLFQKRGEREVREVRKMLLQWSTQMLIIFALAWAIMVSLWPLAHQNPVLNPIHAIQASKSFDLAYPVLFAGNTYMSDQLPSYYMIWFLVLSTPLNILFLMTVGFIIGIAGQLRCWHSPYFLLNFSIQVWIFFPILYFIAFRPNLYDGIRHVLFILPGLALLAGLGAEYLFRKIKCWLGQVPAAIVTCIILFMGSSPLFTMHPYQMSYFNPLAGDPATVHTRYETDYWVSSYKEGAEWINERQRDIQRQLKVLVAANSLSSLCAVRYLDKKIRPYTIFERANSRLLPEPFDYYLSQVPDSKGK
jgi:hypothetical protein